MFLPNPYLARMDRIASKTMSEQNDNLVVENDDYPLFQLVVEEVGEQTGKVFTVLRQVMQLSPAEAKRLLTAHHFEVVRGPRMEIESIQEKLERAGAKTQLVAIQDD